MRRGRKIFPGARGASRQTSHGPLQSMVRRHGKSFFGEADELSSRREAALNSATTLQDPKWIVSLRRISIEKPRIPELDTWTGPSLVLEVENAQPFRQ